VRLRKRANACHFFLPHLACTFGVCVKMLNDNVSKAGFSQEAAFIWRNKKIRELEERGVWPLVQILAACICHSHTTRHMIWDLG
jgi:hypothetical protein